MSRLAVIDRPFRRMRRRDRKAHRRMKCWEKAIPDWWTPSHIRVCPHGVMYDSWRVSQDKSEWREVDPFFIRAGCYDA